MKGKLEMCAGIIEVATFDTAWLENKSVFTFIFTGRKIRYIKFIFYVGTFGRGHRN
jgi:hypothetical protein